MKSNNPRAIVFKLRHVFALLPVLLLFFVSSAYAQNGGAPALTPQMGWTTWNAYGCGGINETVVKANAAAMASNGMQAAGYQYVNLDDCWMATSRDSNGNLQADPNKFPSGIPSLVSYIHGLGFKIGLYEDMGTATCDNLNGVAHPGSYGSYQQDANTFVGWNIDYIKMDWCNTGGETANTVYAQFSQALGTAIANANLSHPIYFSMCEWGWNQPWTWGAQIGGNSWRTTPDLFVPTWSNMIQNLEATGAYFAYGGPGGWNDPDMLQVGNGGLSSPEANGNGWSGAGMTPYQEQTHFSLWAMVSAPLLASTDLTQVNSSNSTTAANAQAAIATMTNTEVIAVDQDALHTPGVLLNDNGAGLQIWAKNVTGGTVLLLLNENATSATITVPFTGIGLTGTTATTVRDLWAHASLGTYTGSYSATVPAYGVSMVKLGTTTTLPTQTVYMADAPGNTLAGGAVVQSCQSTFGYSCLDGNNVGFIGNSATATITMNNITAASSGTYEMLIYGLVSGTRTFYVSVNGGASQQITMTGTSFNLSFPVGMQVPLNAGNNTIQFSNPTAYAPNLDHIVLIGTGVATSSSTVLSSSATTAAYGSSVTLTATVSATNGPATGSVTFYNGTTSLGTVVLGSGIATLTTSTLPLGTNSLTASYGGAANFPASTSSAVSVTVTQAVTSTALSTSSSTPAVGASVTLTATVTVTSGVGTPTGTVTFYTGSASLGTGTLNGSGVATLTTTALPSGTDSVTAVYGGTTYIAPSTSAVLLEYVGLNTINVNGAVSGPQFYGIGAMSAGGGNTRLLLDYPPTQQSQILDYLFKPGVSANLQVLKVEIGGGADSTDGSESSIESNQGTINCNTGYEWWLMEQAQARNPNIKFYALTWTSPGWIGGWWNTNAINYLVSYLTCAQSHGLTISYLGGFNETQGDGTAAWWEQLRSTLNADGFSSVQLIGGDLIDGFNGIANDLNGNAQWDSTMDFIGAHYPCSSSFTSNPGAATSCVPSALTAAKQTGKPMWQSEGGAQDYETGAGFVIRSIVRGYVDGGLVEYNNWPIIAALYPNLDYPTSGLIWADQPWSGWYSVGATTAVIGQITQFTQPGWTFINGGYLQGAESNGTYMTLKSTDGTDYSTIIETTTASAAQTVTFNVSGGLSTGTMNVWATNLGSSSQSNWMVQQSSITPVSGSFSLTLQPNYVYSITTTTGQGFGTATGLASAAMSLPYSDTFGGYATGSPATYESQIQGDFQSQPCVAQSGNCLMQMIATAPSIWFYGEVGTPWAVLGDTSWTNYAVSVNALMEQAGSVYVAGRVASAMGGFNTGTNTGTAPTSAWQAGVSSATVTAGTLVDMGPQPVTGGSWSWTSSNGFTSTAREIDNIDITTSAIYLAVYTDSNGCQSSQYFTFTVTGTPAPTAPTVPTPPCASPTAVTPYLLINTGPFPDGFNGYSLQVGNTGAWALLRNSASGSPTQLAAGTLATAPGLNTWVTLAMSFNGSSITGSIDGTNIASVTDSTWSGGQVGFGILGWQTDQFSNLRITGPCVPTAIVPEISVAGGTWQNTATATVPPGTVVDLGPDPASGGSWSWTGPSGFTSVSREIDSIPLSSGVNTFVATYTNACGSQTTQNFIITVANGKIPQTITFPAPSTPITYGAGSITLGATASSGQAVSYYLTGPGSLSGSTLSFTGAGTVVVTASQAGNSTYNPATSVTQSIVVNSATLTVAVNGSPLSRYYDQPNPAFTYTIGPFVNGDTQAKAITGAPTLTTTAAPKSPAGNYAITVGLGTLASANVLPGLGGGIDAPPGTFAANYIFSLVNGQLTVNGGAAQTIMFPALANFSHGTSVPLVALSSSGLPVSFTVASGSATISGSTLTINGIGPVSVTASQAGNGNFSAATSVTRSFTAQ